MRVLVACEYSGTVRDAFTDAGHHAVSVDLLESETPGPHYSGFDVRYYMHGPWDLMIAHPPCTHLAVSGARWFKDKKKEQELAMKLVMDLLGAKIEKIALENPVGIISTQYRKPDQIIHPWMFGDPYTKRTCLWLKNLPKLVPTDIVDKGEIVVHGGKRIPKWYSNHKKQRDRTFKGIAKAMAEQWGGDG